MSISLDHLIIRVNDAKETVAFYTGVLGMTDEGQDGPFAVVRVDASSTLLFAPWGTQGNEHFAFALPPDDFDATFARIRAAGLAYGDSFHAVGNMRGPGMERGGRGMGEAVYLVDPNRHLIEIRTYRDAAPA